MINQYHRTNNKKQRAGMYTIIKGVVVVLVTILLFIVCSKLAEAERGYKATGGEVLVLLFPFIWYTLKANIKSMKKNRQKRIK